MIFVSAGHSETDPGAIYRDFIEHDEAVTWRDLIVASVNGLIAPVMRVPVGTLEEKVAFINAECAKNHSIAIEVHFNAGGTPGVTKGSETLYCPGSAAGELLARLVQGELAAIFTPDRGVKPGYFRMDPTKPVDYFLRATHCPAIIIEPDFVTNGGFIRAHRIEACHAVAKALVQAHQIVQDTE